MGLIINPFEKTPKHVFEAERAAINQKIYKSYPEVKRRADKLHHNRMLPGDACDQCIAAVISTMAREGVSFNAQEKETTAAKSG